MQTDSRDNGRRKDDGVEPVPRVAVLVAGDGHTLAGRLRYCLGKTKSQSKPVVLFVPVAAGRQFRGFLFLPVACEESWHALRKQDAFHHVSNFNHKARMRFRE